MRSGRAALLAALLLATTACGYGLQGRRGGGFLPSTVRIIALASFENRTARPEIEQRVTEQVARELAKRGGYRVVNDTAGADALLEGAVTDFRTSPVQFTQEGRATQIEAVVSIQATLIDLSNDQVLWSQSGLLFREQYRVPEGGEFFDQETLALDEIARGAAGALVTSLVEGF